MNSSPSTVATSVLIIEDNQDVADSLARFLRIGCGYEVSTEIDGIRGVRAARDNPPDVAIIDIGLPKKNGILVAEELIESLPDRPLVIAVTGYGDSTTRALAEEAGFDHFLTKPADPFAIETLIEDHMRRRSDGHESDYPSP
jgi:DNA-binding response OmpR family regulator